jgi:hypothetical protein
VTGGRGIEGSAPCPQIALIHVHTTQAHVALCASGVPRTQLTWRPSITRDLPFVTTPILSWTMDRVACR